MTNKERHEHIRLMGLVERFCDQCENCINGHMCYEFKKYGQDPTLAIQECEKEYPQFNSFKMRKDD